MTQDGHQCSIQVIIKSLRRIINSGVVYFRRWQGVRTRGVARVIGHWTTLCASLREPAVGTRPVLKIPRAVYAPVSEPRVRTSRPAKGLGDELRGTSAGCSTHHPQRRGTGYVVRYAIIGAGQSETGWFS